MKFNKEKFMEFVTTERISLFRPINLEYSYGCLADSLTANRIQETELTDKERKIILHKIWRWYCKHPQELNNLLQYFIETQAEDFEFTEQACECCGDRAYTFKITI